MADQATKRPMEESPKVVPARPRIHATLRQNEEGSLAAPPPEGRSPLLAISFDGDRGTDDVLELVEPLDVATSALREESRETDQLCLSIVAKCSASIKFILPSY